jgi:hypothetical protein
MYWDNPVKSRKASIGLTGRYILAFISESMMKNGNRHHEKIAFCLFFIVIFSSCSAHKTKISARIRKLKNLTVYPADAQPVYKIAFKRGVAYGSTNNVVIGKLGSIAVDDSGQVYIADKQQNTIHIFEPNGHYLTQLGRKGKGPGEFQNIQDMKINNVHLYVLDDWLFRISVFDLDTFQLSTSFNLSFEDQKNVPLWLKRTKKKGLSYQPSNLYIRPDGSFLVLFSNNSVGHANNIEGRTYEASIFSPGQDKYINTAHNLLSFRWTGQVLARKEDNRMIVMFGVPYKPDSKFDFNNGAFVLGWSEEMLFKFYNQDLTYQRAVYYPYSNVPFHLKDALTYYKQAPENIIRAIRSDSLPKKWPAFNSLKLDDKGRLWISTIVKNMRVNQWWVLNPKGKLLARFNWPRSRKIEIIKNGYLYAKQKDTKEVPRIVRYKIQMQ